MRCTFGVHATSFLKPSNRYSRLENMFPFVYTAHLTGHGSDECPIWYFYHIFRDAHVQADATSHFPKSSDWLSEKAYLYLRHLCQRIRCVLRGCVLLLDTKYDRVRLETCLWTKLHLWKNTDFGLYNYCICFFVSYARGLWNAALLRAMVITVNANDGYSSTASIEMHIRIFIRPIYRFIVSRFPTQTNAVSSTEFMSFV